VELEIPVIAQPPSAALGELAAALSDGIDDRGSIPLGPASTASTAGAYGYPAIALTARESDGFVPVGHHSPADTKESVDPAAVESVVSFAVDLVKLLDRDVARRRGG
jgi:hypothetical protein